MITVTVQTADGPEIDFPLPFHVSEDFNLGVQTAADLAQADGFPVTRVYEDGVELTNFELDAFSLLDL